MKNTTPDAAVLQELKELTSRIFKICEQNNMPVVIGYSYELSRNEDGYSINKSITAYADEKTGAWDSTIAAAAMLLKVKDVPREVIGALKSLSVASDFARAMSEASKEITGLKLKAFRNPQPSWGFSIDKKACIKCRRFPGFTSRRC
ncbi:TPA: hypothetical protein ACIPDZ_004361 [Salmonella enterica subsp. enterica serovar Java]